MFRFDTSMKAATRSTAGHTIIAAPETRDDLGDIRDAKDDRCRPRRPSAVTAKRQNWPSEAPSFHGSGSEIHGGTSVWPPTPVVLNARFGGRGFPLA